MLQPLLLIITAVSILSGLATLMSISADLYGRPVATWSRFRRAMGAALLLVIGIGAGVAAYSTQPALRVEQRNPLRSVHETQVSTTSPTTDLLQAIKRSANSKGDESRLSEPVAVASSKEQDASSSSDSQTRVDAPSLTADVPKTNTLVARALDAGSPFAAMSSILTKNGEHVPELEAIAERFAVRHAYTVSGTLRSSTEQESELMGIFTAKLVLRVTVADISKQPVTAFELISRGGGFDADAARYQALERMKMALEDCLHRLPTALK